MKLKRTTNLYLIAVLVFAVSLAFSGCGGGGGSKSASSATAAKATISGAASIEGVEDCSGVVVVAEKVDDGVTRTVAKLMEEAKAGRQAEARVAADDSGVYMTSTNDSCAYTLSVTPDTYSVTAYKEDTVGAQPRVVAARSAAVVTVNFELVATGKVAGTIILGHPGVGETTTDIVFAYLDGTSFAAFADSSGAYTISNVPVGTYTIKFVREGTVYASNAGVVVTAGAITNSALTSVNYACVQDTDCEDNDDATYDTCANPALSTSACKNTPLVAGGTVISADTTWALADSPLLVTGQIKVASGATLTIQAGVVVKFSYPAKGGDLFNYCCSTNSRLGGIRVDGALIANGTSVAPINFTLADDDVDNGGGFWGGIFGYDGSTLSLQYVNMNYPSYAIQSNYSSSLTISNVNITNAGQPEGVQQYSYSYHIYVKTSSGWKEVGVKHYGLNYQNMNVELGNYLPDADGEYKVRIEQVGMVSAQIESLELLTDGGPLAPVSAVDVSTGQDVTYKVAGRDNDVLDAHLKTFEVKFDPRGAASSRFTLALTAREEDGQVSAYGTPFLFPANSRNDNVNTAAHYTYKLGASKGAPVLDGMISTNDRLPQPAFAQRVHPMSGHPDGTVYGYVKNDDRNLYVTVDFTTDNTMDGTADFAAIYVKVGDTYKRFQVSVGETDYGMVGFNYTGNVNYQHKVYEFAIPLSEIGRTAGGNVDYIVEAYGTSSLFNSVVNVAYYTGLTISDLSVSFDENAIQGNYDGIYLYNLSGATTLTNISVAGAPDYGLYLYYMGNISINGLAVTDSQGGYGLYYYGGGYSGFSCINCSVTGTVNDYNAYISQTSNVTLSNCVMNNGSSGGLYMDSVSGTNTITNCDFSYNGGNGINANYSNLSISNSRIRENCQNGIYLYGDNYANTAAISSSNIIDNGNTGVYHSYGMISATLTNVFLSGNDGDATGVVDSTTTLSTNQKYNVTSVTTPKTAIITATGMPSAAGTAPDCGGYSY